MKTEKSFLGMGWAFPPTFIKANKTVVMLTDEADIKNSLEILISTRIGERILQPQYGSGLSDLIFDSLDTGKITLITDLLKDAILYNEPRIKPDKIILENTSLESLVNIHIAYTISATNSTYNLVYPFYLNQ
ncbi:MAG: phage baseplate assembly protein W [Crocinitomix sp.]|jgi:phage baseplate assembly protein W